MPSQLVRVAVGPYMGGASLAKLVGQTVILDDDFSACMVKISLFNVGRWYHGIAQDQHDHFEAEKLQNPSQIGVARHKVGVAEAKIGVAASPPTE